VDVAAAAAEVELLLNIGREFQPRVVKMRREGRGGPSRSPTWRRTTVNGEECSGGNKQELTLSHVSARERGAMRSIILLTHLAIDMVGFRVRLQPTAIDGSKQDLG